MNTGKGKDLRLYRIIRRLKNWMKKDVPVQKPAARRLPPLFPSHEERAVLALLQAGKQERVSRSARSLRELEYGYMSQFGEDGILEYLTARVPEKDQWFVEFGVQDYVESNTRLLLLRDYWKGLILDGSESQIGSIRNRPDFWRVNLRAECHFLTKENIVPIIDRNGFGGRPGLLSVDIDGNDYWVWEALRELKPWVVVCEYNSTFGPSADVSVPYRADFQRELGHPSGRYFGASLTALVRLGESMGLHFVGVNGAGHNAFFVDPEIQGELPTLSAQEGFRPTTFRETRNLDGELTLSDAWPEDPGYRRLPLHDFRTGRQISVGDIAPD